jgi:hypothetical protein
MRLDQLKEQHWPTLHQPPPIQNPENKVIRKATEPLVEVMVAIQRLALVSGH